MSDFANTSGNTTAILLDKIRGGDAAARVILIERVEPLLRRFARGRIPQLLRRDQDTADLLQWTWLKVLERLDQIQTQQSGDFFAYLRTALINGLNESLRRMGRNPVVSTLDFDLAQLSLPAESVDLTDWLAYEQALTLLPKEHRNLVLMRFEFGMSFSEIGEEVGQSPDGVRLKISRACARMASQVSLDAKH